MSEFTDEQILGELRGHEVAGGEGYEPDVHPSDADREVDSYSGLKSALSSSAEVIAIANDAEIRINEHMDLNLRDKTLVSYRGIDGQDGGLLYSTRRGYVGSRPFTPMYADGSDSPEIHNLRIRGADHSRTSFRPARDSSGNTVYRDTLTRAIMLRGPGGRVSNCRIWGWAWNGVHLKGRDGRVTRAEVDHCHMGRSMQVGYGYAIEIGRGHGDIHHNYFNATRGAVDGFGWAESGYDVYNNVFGPTNYRHAVDMHCLAENSSSTTQTNTSHPRWALRAGGTLNIRNNQFCFNRSSRGTGINCVAIRGVPMDEVNIEGNWMLHSRRPPRNSANNQAGHAWRQVNVRSNSYGSISLDSRGFTHNFNDADNEFGVSTLQLDALGESSSNTSGLRVSWDDELARREALYRRLADIRAELSG